MRLIHGWATHHRLRELNTWSKAYLPNALGTLPIPGTERRVDPGAPRVLTWAARVGELVLRTWLGGVLDRIEMTYRLWKYRRRLKSPERWIEALFTVDCFKGHDNPRQRQIMTAFAERLR
jgi:hypothetical protein